MTPTTVPPSPNAFAADAAPTAAGRIIARIAAELARVGINGAGCRPLCRAAAWSLIAQAESAALEAAALPAQAAALKDALER